MKSVARSRLAAELKAYRREGRELIQLAAGLYAVAKPHSGNECLNAVQRTDFIVGYAGGR